MNARRFTMVALGFLAGGFIALLVNLILLGNQQTRIQTQIDQLRGQIVQAQRAGQQAQAQFVSERAAFAQAEARIGGTHRDLITCADWSGMFVSVSGTDSFGGQLAASAGPPPLPQHCINQ